MNGNEVKVDLTEELPESGPSQFERDVTAEAGTSMTWQLIETCPKANGVRYLLCGLDGNERVSIGQWTAFAHPMCCNYWHGDDYEPVYNVTHWMPLPCAVLARAKPLISRA